MKTLFSSLYRRLLFVVCFVLASTGFSFAQTSASSIPVEREDLMKLAESISRLSKLGEAISGDDIARQLSDTIQTIYESMRNEPNINKLYAQTYLIQAYAAVGLNYFPSLVMLHVDSTNLLPAANYTIGFIYSVYDQLEETNFSDHDALLDLALLSDVYMSMFAEFTAKFYGVNIPTMTAWRLYQQIYTELNGCAELSSPEAKLQHALAAEGVLFFHAYIPLSVLYSADPVDYRELLMSSAGCFDTGLNFYNVQCSEGKPMAPMAKDEFAKYLHESMQYHTLLVDQLHTIWTAFSKENPSMLLLFMGNSEQEPAP